MAGARGALKLIQGTVDLLILRALTRGPQHGYGVSAWIRERSRGELGIDEAAYEITRKGRRHLTEQSATWRRYARAVSAVREST